MRRYTDKNGPGTEVGLLLKFTLVSDIIVADFSSETISGNVHQSMDVEVHPSFWKKERINRCSIFSLKINAENSAR